MGNNTDVNGSGSISHMFLDLSPETMEKIYNSIFLVFVYMVPLSVIIVTYANIIAKIYRKSKEEDDTHYAKTKSVTAATARKSSSLSSSPPPHSGLRHTPSTCSLRRSRRSFKFARSQTVALRMSTMHVLAFVGCWTPYLVISLWHILDPQSVESVSAEVQDALFLTAVFNSCIDPLVYGGFYFKVILT
jgi:gonadotropin-releasing hormone receptor